jgi:molecular chaperone GrpE (heat shock protein)
MSLNSPSNDADPSAQLPCPEERGMLLTQGYWVRLTNQMDRLQASVDDVLAVTQASESQVEALLRHLTDPARSQDLDERLAGLLAGQEDGQAQWQALAGSLNDLGQTVAKLNRTQFKSNALAEMKDQQVATALDTLQDVAARREQVQESRALHEQERATALRAEARGEFAADLLPALDGLELALDSGRAMLARRRGQEAETARLAQGQSAPPKPGPARPGFWQRLAWAIRGRGLPPGSMPESAGHAMVPSAPPPTPPQRDEMAAALEAWLQGLEMVRTRFLALLATADIYPIQAEGQPFDPRLHLAMATESRSGAPDGTVVAVLRKGYRQRGRVLRYAEVAVNHAASPEIGASTAGAPGDMGAAQREDHLQRDNPSQGSEI